jgi:hypothetical protein
MTRNGMQALAKLRRLKSFAATSGTNSFNYSLGSRQAQLFLRHAETLFVAERQWKRIMEGSDHQRITATPPTRKSTMTIMPLPLGGQVKPTAHTPNRPTVIVAILDPAQLAQGTITMAMRVWPKEIVSNANVRLNGVTTPLCAAAHLPIEASETRDVGSFRPPPLASYCLLA